ncbi:hypothetical protein [Actinomycetospora aeridis]|uniref:Uncharacterized protein n=1 Tax=Actinomycetospora aeridis TaxID=3129231 RepID=A0ABU8N240_9PSEU
MALPARVADLASYDVLLSVAELGSMGRAAAAHARPGGHGSPRPAPW